jgi:signal transduction histidine kinase
MTIIVNPFPPEICLNVISDKHWFSENILCLLSNAVKYSNGGTINVIVELIVQDSKEDGLDRSMKGSICNSSIKISIEDTGIGLSKEIRKTLFQPFQQVCIYRERHVYIDIFLSVHLYFSMYM